MINHYNKTLIKYILNIMKDYNAKNIIMIKQELESTYGLILEKDYKNYHLYNALTYLKKSGQLKNIQHSVYIKENNTINIYNEFLNLLYSHYQDINSLYIRINRNNPSDEHIKNMKIMHDYQEHIEKTIEQVNQIILKNNS